MIPAIAPITHKGKYSQFKKPYSTHPQKDVANAKIKRERIDLHTLF